MILEKADLQILPGYEADFERAFTKAVPIISSMKGFISLELLKCTERQNGYLLLVKWDTLEDHTIGFRQSEKYQEWKSLLHHFYSPFPVIEHFTGLNFKDPL